MKVPLTVHDPTILLDVHEELITCRMCKGPTNFQKVENGRRIRACEVCGYPNPVPTREEYTKMNNDAIALLPNN